MIHTSDIGWCPLEILNSRCRVVAESKKKLAQRERAQSLSCTVYTAAVTVHAVVTLTQQNGTLM